MSISIDDLSKQTEYYSEIETYTGKASENLLDIEGHLGRLTKSVNNISNIFGTTLAIGSFKSISKQLWDIDRSTTQISVRMGKGREGARQLKSTITELQTEFGAAAESALEITTNLAKSSYIGNIKEAAKASYLFSDATGVAASEVTAFTDNMSKVLGFSEKGIASMYAGITKVQQATGISERSMSGLVEHIQSAATNMKAFGKTDEQIKSMAVNSAKLVSSFEKVGLSAQKSLEWVERLTDPERIEDNIKLYSQLGISMSDALSGADITEQLESGMIEFGQKLKSMGPIAGAQYAKAFGVSYKDAIKAANAQSATVDALTPEEQAMNSLQDMATQTHSITRELQNTFNRVTGMINGLGPVILTVLTIGSIFIKKSIRKSKKELSSMLTDGVNKGITQGVERAKASIQSGKRGLFALFDTTSLKEAERTYERIRKESGVHGFTADLPIIGGLVSGTQRVGREFSRLFDGFRVASKNYKDMDTAWLKNRQVQMAEYYLKAKSQEEQLTSLLNNSNLTLKEKHRIENLITNLQVQKNYYQSRLTGETQKEFGIQKSIKQKYLELASKDKEKINNYRSQLAIMIQQKQQLEKAEISTAMITNEIKNMHKELAKSELSYEHILQLAEKASDAVRDGEAAPDEKTQAPGKFRQIMTKLGTRKDRSGTKKEPITMGQAFGGAVLNALSGLGKIAGKIGMIFGVTNIALALLRKPIEKLRAAIGDRMEPILDAICTSFEPLIDVVVACLPGVMNVLSYGIGFIGRTVGLLLTGIAKIMKAFGKDSSGLEKAASSLSNIGVSMREAINGNTAATKENTNREGATRIMVDDRGGLIKEQGSTSTTSSTSSGTSSNSVVNYGSATGISKVTIAKTQEDKKYDDELLQEIKNMNHNIKKLSEDMIKNYTPKKTADETNIQTAPSEDDVGVRLNASTYK